LISKKVVIHLTARRTMNWLAAIALIGILICSAMLVERGNGIQSAAASQSEIRADRPITSLRDLNNAFVELAETVNPTVVTVFTEKVLRVRQSPYQFFDHPFNDFFGEFFQQPRAPQGREREYRQQGLGSGVVVSPDGHIITNNHVIAGADTINVRFLDGETLPAEVVGADEKTDIAVLRVDADNLASIKIGDSDDLRVGEMVLAIGSPLSPNLAHSVTSGIVSAKGRSNVGLADYEDFIQTDAAINPGNSGGALINLDGELIGINTAIASRSGGYQGIGFAVPSNMASRIMNSLIEHGTVVRGWLGIYIQNIDETLAAAMELEGDDGALVADVTEDGPAEKAGVKQGDIIVALDGKEIENSTQLRNEVAVRQPGSKTILEILRDGKKKRITVTLAELPTDEVAEDVGERLEEQFGFTVVPFDAELATKYRLNRSLDGVVVTSVAVGGPAERAGLREGDLIVEINRSPTKDLDQFNEQVRNLKKGNTFLLRVVRANRSFYVGFRL
jgi:serine protease Do